MGEDGDRWGEVGQGMRPKREKMSLDERNFPGRRWHAKGSVVSLIRLGEVRPACPGDD